MKTNCEFCMNYYYDDEYELLCDKFGRGRNVQIYDGQ